MNLKYFSGLILCLTLCTISAFAQKPETVYSVAHVIKPNEFYIEQIGLWKKVLDKDKGNAAAWYNYYKANRYAHISSGNDDAYKRNRFERLQAVVKEVEANVPNTFEAHIIKWANGYNDWNLLPELKKAYEIDSSRIETYDGFINLYEANRDMNKRDYFLKKWYQTGTVSPGLLNYNYNVLKSLQPNAILITAGDNDTYFAWMLQAVWGIRKDVTIVNVGLASMKDYANRLSNELGINLPNTEDQQYEDYTRNFYKALVGNKAKRPVYAGLTVGDEFTRPVADNLYLIGLAYEYSDQKIDNIAILKKNLEKEYALDYLDASFGIDTYETVVACANSNYVVPMLTLYNHYKLSGDTEKANYWKEKAKQVAKKGGKEDEMKDYFKE